MIHVVLSLENGKTLIENEPRNGSFAEIIALQNLKASCSTVIKKKTPAFSVMAVIFFMVCFG